MVNGFVQMEHFDRAREYFDRILKEGMASSRYTVTGILYVFTCTSDFGGGRRIHGLVVNIGYGFDVVISNSLIDFYGKCHDVEDADEVFESMFERYVFSWNSILSAFEYSVEYQKVLQLFGEMLRDRVQPDSITVAVVLPACSRLAALVHGQETHGYVLRNGIRGNVFAHNALINMYAKCGALEDACNVFAQRGPKILRAA